jgi:murein tripeptide amidase MpaA
MKKLYLIIVLIMGLILGAFSQDSPQEDINYLLVRVYLDQAKDLDKLDGLYIELVSRIVDKYADVIICYDDLEKINHLGFRTEILDITDGKAMIDPEYHTYDEYVQAMQQFAMDHPEITVLDTIGTSHFLGYHILSMKISDNPEIEEDEPAVLYDGMHHAREPVGMETCLAIIEHLLTNYTIDPDVTEWINNTEIFVVPMLNPDGWMYIVDEDLSSPWWRKNLHDNDSNGVFEPMYDGVDLNRNYDFNWVHGIHDPSSWNYCGTEPFSEKETQAKRDLALEQKFVMSITYHSYGEFVYAMQGSLGQPMPDADLNYNLTTELASRIPKLNSGTYDVITDEYCMGGFSDCWMYFTKGTFEFTVETAPGFIPDGADALQIAQDNIEGAMYLLEKINGPGITGRITDLETGEPLVATIKILDYDNETITPRTSDSTYGRYTRLLLPATYAIEVSKPGYISQTIPDIVVGPGGNIVVDVILEPLGFGVTSLQEEQGKVVVYPNPVNTLAEFRYQISDIRNVNLSIFDAYGRLVETLVDGIQQPGEYTVSWNAENLPSGIYIYRLMVGDEVVSGKIIKR